MNPAIDLRQKPAAQIHYLQRLTDRNGLLQHTSGNTPDPRFGYAIDDNARAAVVAAALVDQFRDIDFGRMVKPYLHFMAVAQTPHGWFINFYDAAMKPREMRGSDDSFARTVWALSVLQARRSNQASAHAKTLLAKSLRHVTEIRSLRSIAFLTLAACAQNDPASAKQLAKKMVRQFQKNAAPDWQWFDDTLTYANALMPWALAQTAHLTGDKVILAVARRCFDFLDRVSRSKGVPAPIGNKGWYPKGSSKPLYDQQPIDAADMVLAAVAFYKATRDDRYKQSAIEWFNWFHGNNTKKVVLLNSQTGGVHDGITPSGVNPNQGAENIVLYLLAYCALRSILYETDSSSR